MREKRKAAFFDRDGTINVDVGYLHRPEDLLFVKRTPELIRAYNDNGYLVIVVTNQSGIARGMYSEKEMEQLHKVMNFELERQYGAHIDAFYYCPHLPEITGECGCRKPHPGLFIRAIEDYNIDVRKYIISNFKEDSIEDIEKSISTSIESKSEDPLIGLGVLFEIMWNNSSNDIKDTILSNIKKGLSN